MAYVAGDPSATSVVDQLFSDGGELLTCDVIVCETLSGGTDEERSALRRLIDALEFVATDPDAARWAADARRSARATGRSALPDALIGGVAWRTDATVVTRNRPDFARQGLSVLTF